MRAMVKRHKGRCKFRLTYLASAGPARLRKLWLLEERKRKHQTTLFCASSRYRSIGPFVLPFWSNERLRSRPGSRDCARDRRYCRLCFSADRAVKYRRVLSSRPARWPTCLTFWNGDGPSCHRGTLSTRAGLFDVLDRLGFEH